MGGRGSKSSLTNQISLQDIIDRKEIEEIRERAERIRQGNIFEGKTIDKSNLKECACCNNYTIPIDAVNYRCPICGWIDDEEQNNNPDSLGGPNSISLREAKQIWESTKNKD